MTTDLVAVDSKEGLKDDEIAVTKESVAVDELEEEEVAVTMDLIAVDSNGEQGVAVTTVGSC